MRTAVYRRPNKLWRSNSIFNLCLEYSRSPSKYGGVGPWIFIFIYIPPSIDARKTRQYAVFIISWWLDQSCSGARKVWQRSEVRQDAVVFAISWRLSFFNKHLDHRQVFLLMILPYNCPVFIIVLGMCCKKIPTKFSQKTIFILKNLGEK